MPSNYDEQEKFGLRLDVHYTCKFTSFLRNIKGPVMPPEGALRIGLTCQVKGSGGTALLRADPF